MDINNFLIKDLKAAIYNPREISDEAFDGLKASIKKFGMPSEIKNKDGVITMDDFSHIAELGYLPHHTIHVSKKGIKITYLMYKLEEETLEKEITISTRVGFAE